MEILVTGAGGFLGGAITQALLTQGHSVRGLQRHHSSKLADTGVVQHLGDLTDPDLMATATNGCDAVIHVAAKAGAWGDYDSYFEPNVLGTRRVVEACIAQGVPRLVYTSTPSVVHGGGDLEGVDESAPYPTHFHAPYPATKAEAEKMVLAANCASLATVALRPHLIWGPGDNNLLPRLIDRARAGRLAIVGTPKKVDTTYISNAADAHVRALHALAPNAACAGKAYFISNGEPLLLDDILNRLLACADLGPIQRRVPLPVAYAAGALLELLYKVLPLSGEPAMTRFLAKQFATAHWYNISAAERDLGYKPAVTIAEGLTLLRAWYAAK